MFCVGSRQNEYVNREINPMNVGNIPPGSMKNVCDHEQKKAIFVVATLQGSRRG